jgi:single-strand DNA-binding protein
MAEIIGEYVKKGSKIYIEGRLQTSSWDDKETGQKKYKTEIIANELVLLGGRGEGADTEGGGKGYSRSASAGTASSGGNFDQSQPHQQDPAQATQIQDEDIPF